MSVLDVKIGVKIPATDLQISAYWGLEREGTTEGLGFNKEGHIFTFNNQILPSVTWILKQMGLTPDYSLIDPFYATRGRYLHRATELYDKDTLDIETLDDEIAPYFEQYIESKKEFPFEIIEIEAKKRHPIHGYAGIIDRIITGNKSYVLYLTKENFKLVEVTNMRHNLNIFLSALNVYRWKEQNLKEATNGSNYQM